MSYINTKGELVADMTPVRVEVLRGVFLRDLDQGGAMRACAAGEIVRVTRDDANVGITGSDRVRLVR